MYNESGSFAEGYAIGRDTANNGFGSFGGDWSWWIIILLLFGWGNNGFGGGFGGNGGNMFGYELGKIATTNDVASGFNNSAVLSSLNDLKLGQAGLQQTLCQGFNGINTSVLTSTNDLSRQLADCCCATQRAIDGVNFNNSKNTCDIINAQERSAQRIIDFLTTDKINSLQAENAVLTNQLSQNSQTTNIINALRPVAQPAYITCSPFESIYGASRFYNNNSCGCGL